MSLLRQLEDEAALLDGAGRAAAAELRAGAAGLLGDLRLLEHDLELQIDADGATAGVAALDKSAAAWYKRSIGAMKTYNALLNRFQKNVAGNRAFGIDLDDAYPYKLSVDDGGTESLHRAIALHLLKSSERPPPEFTADAAPAALQQLLHLKRIVDDIAVRHRLTEAIAWLDRHSAAAAAESKPRNLELEFKFHVLQYVLILNGVVADADGSGVSAFPAFDPHNQDNAAAAYRYSQQHFPRYFEAFPQALQTMVLLLCFVDPTHEGTAPPAQPQMGGLFRMMRLGILRGSDRPAEDAGGAARGGADTRLHGPSRQLLRFVQAAVANFRSIHDATALFLALADEFTYEYCHAMGLLGESLLFEAVLAGFLNLPSFHKYSQIERKLGRAPHDGGGRGAAAAPYSFELPFQLPDSNALHFSFHPIFICPVLKEQLMPVEAPGDGARTSEKEPAAPVVAPPPLYSAAHGRVAAYAHPLALRPNTAVVLKFCHHLALRDSVMQLSLNGTEMFKCHYCYKKHKLSDVSDVYFIDL